MFDEHQRQFVKLADQLADHHSSTSLRDFAELAAISLQNSLARHDDIWKTREQRYMDIMKTYSEAERQVFPQMFGCIALSLESKMRDVVGELYMSDELATRSKWDSDVAFTPWEVSYMMAKMTLGNAQLPTKGYLTFCEPAAGTGSMVIAAAQALKDSGINFQRAMHVTAVEIRELIAHLCFIQLSLLNIPAVVVHGNTLSLEEWSHWYTPAHQMGAWSMRLRINKALTEVNKPLTEGKKLLPPVNKKGQFGFDFNLGETDGTHSNDHAALHRSSDRRLKRQTLRAGAGERR